MFPGVQQTLAVPDCTKRRGDLRFCFLGRDVAVQRHLRRVAVKGYYQESGEETQYFRVLPKLALNDKALVSRLVNALQVTVRVVTPGLISAAWLEALMGPLVHFV